MSTKPPNYKCTRTHTHVRFPFWKYWEGFSPMEIPHGSHSRFLVSAFNSGGSTYIITIKGGNWKPYTGPYADSHIRKFCYIFLGLHNDVSFLLWKILYIFKQKEKLKMHNSSLSFLSFSFLLELFCAIGVVPSPKDLRMDPWAWV